MGPLVEAGDRGLPQGNPAVHDGEFGLAVLDAHLVRIGGGEEKVDGEGE